jgi:hypothetical protein
VSSHRAVTFVQTRWGVSDPRSERVRGRLPGMAEGVAHAHGSLSTIIRAASAAAENAAPFAMCCESASSRTPAGCGFSRVTRQHRQLRRSRVRFSGLKGTTQIRGVVPLLVPHAPLRSCDKLALAQTATRGRAR